MKKIFFIVILIMFIPVVSADNSYLPSFAKWLAEDFTPTFFDVTSAFFAPALSGTDWLSYPTNNYTINIQKESAESPTVLRLDDLLHEEKKQQQYDIQETILDLILGAFILILDIIIIVYYILELWFFMMLFGKWIPALFKKMANSTGNFFIKMRSRR